MKLLHVLVIAGLLVVSASAQDAPKDTTKKDAPKLEEIEALKVENGRIKLANLTKDFQMAQQQIALAQQAIEKIQAEFQKAQTEQSKFEQEIHTKYKVDIKTKVIDTGNKTFVDRPTQGNQAQ